MQSREVMRDKLCEGNHSSLSLRSTLTPEIWEQITHPMLYIEARLLRRTLAPPGTLSHLKRNLVIFIRE